MTDTIRAYQGADDLTLMQNTLARWIHTQGSSAGYCHVGDIPHRIYNGTRGRYPIDQLVELAFSEAGELIGFIMCEPFHDAFDVFIHPQHHGAALETELVGRAYQQTRSIMDRLEREEKPIIVDAQEDNQHRIAVLSELGFERGKIWMHETERSLIEPIPEPILPEGFSIRPAIGEEEAHLLAEVHNNSFNPSWTMELYRDTVMRMPGYDAHREMVVVAPDGRFVAFCIYWLDSLNKIGLFEPVGTHQEFQRRGLGHALMTHTLGVMRSQQMETAHVNHGANNPAAKGLYTALGFTTTRLIYEFVKNPD